MYSSILTNLRSDYFYSLIAPAVSTLTINLWSPTMIKTAGKSPITLATAIRCIVTSPSVWVSAKFRIPTEIGKSWESLRKMKGIMKFPQALMVLKTKAVAIPGTDRGRIILTRV
jgi:hypothetical protein